MQASLPCVMFSVCHAKVSLEHLQKFFPEMIPTDANGAYTFPTVTDVVKTVREAVYLAIRSFIKLEMSKKNHL